MKAKFTQIDPIGLAGGLNLYGYAGGDPVNFSDPFGLCQQRSGIGRVLNAFTSSCATRDEAAMRGMRAIYAKSVKEDVEYGAELVSDKYGFRYVTPRRGSKGSVGVNPRIENYEGAYHSHGAPDPTRPNRWENFSDDDRELADNYQKPVYVVTPSGKMKRYNPDHRRQGKGQEKELGHVQP